MHVETFWRRIQGKSLKIFKVLNRFQISKTILTAHSEVFKAMFENDLNEKSSGVVEIEDTDSKTMIALIEYMHTETVHNLDENEVALDLFKAADKYLIQELKVCQL